MVVGRLTFLLLLGAIAAVIADAPHRAVAAEQAVPTPDSRIRLNTIGFLPGRLKRASIAAACTRFSVRRADSGKDVYAGTVSGPVHNADSNEDLYTADFSALKATGTYYLEIPGVGRSADFRIAPDVYNDAFYLVTRGMYLWRCGVAVSATYRGDTFAHAACHTSDGYMDFVGGGHTKRDGTGGWHDAGDYNKYVVNAGISVGSMLQAWEQFPDRLKAFRLDLPESGNGIPDYLNEVKFELDWLLKMQAPDGSVYHKLTTQNFGGFVLPEEETTDRFFTPWGSPATADFVAMLAMAARIYRPYDAPYADRCLQAAVKSYGFLQAHPENHAPDQAQFHTGGYGANDMDGRLWAAAELWQSTGESAYLKDFETRARAWQVRPARGAAAPPEAKIEPVWDWGDVANQGMFTYLLSKRPGRDAALVQQIHDSLLAAADAIVKTRDAHGYARPLGETYYWGCNGAVARQTALLQTAHQIAPNPAYIDTALDAIGHLFGRNYFGRSFVTGLGANPPLHPHDRRSGGDKVAAPWPGYLVGGGWPGAQDWKDSQDSYQTNEIAINWNTALIYALAGFVEPKGR